ncbi:TPA: hypothetical protein DCY43_04020 [candidate division WWE3 bacterium]|uniref:Probable peptidoglycan glycosyltransferase FtsW n=5 Tax=Katanobacteria TaxID=422282 RepID=A0A0G1NKA7_UNCKA|nr:MAG: Cell cycle protein [candidate division WWE3 bacterium GW2011_GWA2_44_16]KKT69895.1 MAG: Cell cycle protein [candidate division WWE3 bacterium GW2011_GWB1_44_4]KKT84594.1 MAG: Cell cycle protein [candidate division WWE3 bacterium GW2011_GWC2_44_9]OGC51176.1 MAG: hypothetical protein A2709_02325 [candidate division WWE3 bacterium RIFCSPHIGHO2_01_FULL_43_9]HAZ29875.1 hypothetical protein [candidate division WWE3 bacterium]
MNKTAAKSRRFYYLLFGVLLFGVLMVYNASPLYAQRLFNDPYYFFKLQVTWTLFGIAFFIIFSRIKFQTLKRIAKPLFYVSLFFLFCLAFFATFFPCTQSTTRDITFFPCKNGARRWVNLNPVPLPQIPLVGTIGFQASDLAKLAMVLYLPLVLEEKRAAAKSKYAPFVFFIGACLLTSVLILFQPNMSNAGLVLLIGLAIYDISGLDVKPVLVMAPLGLVLGMVFILISPYRRERFITLVVPHQQSKLSESYQSDQILIGLGSGGLFGVGVGQSKQKQHYLPEVIGDSIFAIVGEELGYIGSVLVLVAFAFLSLDMLKIASEAGTVYEKMVGVGVTAWLFFQYLINIFATIGLIPFTGMPIPLISYGGSSMLFALSGMGLLANIYARRVKKPDLVNAVGRGRMS